MTVSGLFRENPNLAEETKQLPAFSEKLIAPFLLTS
jgi:hypothetical protein